MPPLRWNSPKEIAALVTVVGLAALGVWALSSHRGEGREDPSLPRELSVEALKAQSSDPRKLFDTVRNTVQRDDLTDEQRRQVRRNLRQVWLAEMNERVEAYFEADEDGRVAILDKQIDDYQELMKEWQKRREQRRQEAERRGESDRRERWRRFARATQAERKERSESRNPDRRVRWMTYFAALRDRMAERGISMPGGGPGGFGRFGAGFHGRRP